MCRGDDTCPHVAAHTCLAGRVSCLTYVIVTGTGVVVCRAYQVRTLQTGTLRVFELSRMILHDTSGKRRRLAGMIADVTSRMSEEVPKPRDQQKGCAAGGIGQ